MKALLYSALFNIDLDHLAIDPFRTFFSCIQQINPANSHLSTHQTTTNKENLHGITSLAGRYCPRLETCSKNICEDKRNRFKQCIMAASRQSLSKYFLFGAVVVQLCASVEGGFCTYNIVNNTYAGCWPSTKSAASFSPPCVGSGTGINASTKRWQLGMCVVCTQ